MSLQSLLNSPLGVGGALTLGRLIPPSIGYRLSSLAAHIIASRNNSKIVQSVRANQWVVSGQQLNAEQLDHITLETFRHTAVCLYDLYHNLNRPKEIARMVKLSDKLHNTLDESLKSKRSTVFIAPHLSNFDLAGRAFALHGYNLMVLSYPQPPGGYRWQNRMRKQYGIDIVPMSTESLREGKERLRSGGAILTGMDRPLPSSNYAPKFFGFPAPVPVTYVRLGIMTNSTIVVAACIGMKPGQYVVDCSAPIELIPHADIKTEIEINAEKALREAEKFIRAHPEQWSMFYPVWPWALEKAP